MGMYFMNGKTFIKTYIEEDPNIVFDTQYVIVSNTIRKNDRYGQVLNGNNILFPSTNLIIDTDDYKHDDDYRNEYFKQLDEAKPFLATLITYVLEEGYTIVFLCGESESKYNYLKLLSDYVAEEFNFYIYDYKKYKKGKVKIRDIDEYEILDLCKRILKRAKKDKKNKILSGSEKAREAYISEMSKSEMKKELKKRDLYFSGMSKDDMIDMLMTFMRN